MTADKETKQKTIPDKKAQCTDSLRTVSRGDDEDAAGPLPPRQTRRKNRNC